MNKVVLSSIIDVISGGTPKTKVAEYWNGNVGWLSVTDFNNDLRYVYKTEKTITELGVQKSNTKYLEKGDIIISARGTVGALAQIGKPMCFNQSCFGIRGKKGIADTDFLYYSLKNYVKHIVKRSQGSVFDTINLKSFDLMEVEIPKDLQTQKAIAKVLSDLDAKIELNNKINAELEAMAKLIYDYWFVQFDFPCLPSDYRPHGQVNPNNNLTNAIKSVCTYTQVGGLPVPDGKKWFVYVIECIDGTFYKGMTNDLYRRYYEHKTGQGAEWTKVHKPKRVIHHETFSSQQEAAKREKELKTGYGRTWIKREYDKLLKYGAVSKSSLPAHQTNSKSTSLPAHQTNSKSTSLPAHQTRLMTAGKMVYNEELKREIPEGWEVKSLLGIADFTNGIACQKYRPLENEDFYRVIKIREMGDGFTSKSEFVSKSIPDKVVVNNGDILFSWSATLDVKIWTGGIGGLNQHIFKVTSDIYPRTFYYFEVLQYLQYFKMVADLRKTTMGHITRDHLKQSRISTPPKELINKLHEKINPIIKKLVKGKEENQKLSELRDWLLPMLMNGQVTVGGVEENTQMNMAAEARGEYKKN